MNYTLFKTSVICASFIMLTACQETGAQQTRVNEASPAFTTINELKNTKLEVAITDAEHQIGLMNRTSLDNNAGMIFVFSKTSPYCFWMKNTLIPLTVGFIDEQGVLQQTEDMEPQTLNTHCAKTPVKYAIEMNKGWFADHKIQTGTQLLHIQNK